MILTPLNIQVAIIKAFYALAKKSVKYYTGLALGKNNTCLFKEIRLLRAYIEILRNFEIVGSTITCSCCIEGDYTVLLNSQLPVTNTPIQFDCNNQGYMVFNNVGYNFTYWYDEFNQKIVIDFTGTLNNVVITITGVQFTDTCDITGTAVSPIEVAELPIIDHELAVTVDNDFGTWNGSITVYEPDGVTNLSPPVSLTIPAVDMDNIEAILELWNTTYPDWILQYSGGQFVLYSPFDNVDYNNYVVKFRQYEGGSDSFVNFDLSGLPAFVTQGTPAYADILFQQPTFVASHVADTLITLPSGRLPYKTTPTPASANILIPINQFALGQPATMSIPLLELFNSTAQDFYYEGALMFSHSGSYADMTALINSFDSNNGQGFTASDGGFAPIPGEVLATASNALTIFNTAALGNVYTVKLVNVPLGNISTTIGTYTVASGDSPADVANFIAANIIAQGIFQGTVSVSGTVITLTAPLGTGNSWNYNAGVSTYAFSIEKPGDRPILYYFNGGVGTPTTPVHLLNITAPNIYPQTDYDGDIIEIQYPVEFYEPDGSQFAGAVNDTDGSVNFFNSSGGVTLYQSAPGTVFTSIQEMLIDFNLNPFGAIATIVSNNGITYTVNVELPAPPAWAYNGTTLTYTYDPSVGRTYVDVGTYSGGADTTEATYTLVILDGGNIPYGLPITNTGNFINLQSIVNDLNSQPTFNSNFIASLSGTNLVITTVYSLQGAFFNNYTFQLTLDYTSLQYTANDFISTIGIMANGINAVSPEINFVNDQIPLTILNLLQNSYDVDGISGFVDYFNNLSPFNYSATLLGTQQALPEILSQSLLNMFGLSEIPNTVLKTYYQPIGFPPSPPVLIGTFTPTISADYTANGLASGLASAINLNPWTGTASAITSTLKLLSPSGTFGSYNNYLSIITKTIPNARASVPVIVTTGAVVSGSMELTVSLGSVSLGVRNFPIPQTAAQCATLYKDRINSGTGTHGYTAVAIGTTILIFAPVNTGTILNNATISAVTTGGVAIQTVPTPTFSNGTDTTTTIITSNFTGGGFTTYDEVRFTADPNEQTWIYNGEDFIYNNVTDSYSDPDQFTGGIDTTIGSLSLLLTGTAVPFFPGTSPYTLYNDGSPVNYSSFQQWSTAIDNSINNLGFGANSLLTDFIINSPLNSFAYFNGNNDIELFYTYDSPQYAVNNYGQSLPLENGVDPVLTPYEGIFAAGVLGDFINTNPCTPTVAEQTCLTNNQVSKIITHINKLTK
jgi:hypothetical protein